MSTHSGILPLRLEKVSYAVHGRTLIDAIDVTLTAGARTMILGPNGAGKSLLLRLCHGLITPTSFVTLTDVGDNRLHWRVSRTSRNDPARANDSSACRRAASPADGSTNDAGSPERRVSNPWGAINSSSLSRA